MLEQMFYWIKRLASSKYKVVATGGANSTMIRR
jgi:hypothetical protein